jgi:hypothetical protein
LPSLQVGSFYPKTTFLSTAFFILEVTPQFPVARRKARKRGTYETGDFSRRPPPEAGRAKTTGNRVEKMLGVLVCRHPAGAEFEFPDTLSHGLTPVASGVSPPAGAEFEFADALPHGLTPVASGVSPPAGA